MERNAIRGNSNGFQRLPNDIIIDILFRLSIESIMFCKSTCKAFYTIINDGKFINLQFAFSKSSQSQSHILFEALKSGPSVYRNESVSRHLFNLDSLGTRKIAVYPHNGKFPEERMPIVSVLDGLICFTTEKGHPGPVVISNPLITGDYVRLPESNIPRAYGHIVTFGFDPSINKYKVVKILTDALTIDVTGCEVFTIGKDASWRRIVYPYRHDRRVHFLTRGVFHGRSIYWMVIVSSSIRCILEFDLTKEEFSMVDFPILLGIPSFSGRNIVQMQSLGDHISLIKGGREVHIWRIVKHENGSSEVIGHRKMTIESLYRFATVDGLTFLNNNEDLFLLREHGGSDPVKRDQNGVLLKISGTHFSFYRPALRKNNRLTHLTSLQNLFTDATVVNYWGFKPSLISVKKAMLNGM